MTSSSGSSDAAQTQSEQIEQNLSGEQRLLALEAAQMGTWCWDLQNQTVAWDVQCGHLFGQPAGTLTMTYDDFIGLLHPEDRAATEEAVLDARDNLSEYDMIHRVVWRDGSVHWLRCKGKLDPLRSSRYMVGIALEISWLKRIEEVMRTNERMAAQAAMANELAHEINNPLEIICNSLYLLSTSSPNPAQQRLLFLADEGLDRITRITRHLLSLYSREERPARFNMAQCLQAVGSKFSGPADQRRIRMEIRCDEKLEFFGLQNDVRKIVSALLANSLENVLDGGRVVVHSYPCRDWSRYRRRGIRLLIADNGSGIPAAMRSVLFNPFASEKKGSGLGLWSCNTIVSRYGGSIRVRSSLMPGRSGTLVSVFLRPMPETPAATEGKPFRIAD